MRIPNVASAADKLRVLVLGYLVRGPIGGLVWHHVQYAIGLARLGHDVFFFEDSDDYPSCYDPATDRTGSDPAAGLATASTIFNVFGLGDRWAYYDAHSDTWHGCAADRREQIFASADLLLNLSGVNPLRPWLMGVPRRAFVDTDPAFTQIRHLTEPSARALVEQHNLFFTYAENIGEADCLVPDDGFRWQPTRQPIVLDAWPVTAGNADGRWTTVMQWDSYTPMEHNGRQFGMKSASFSKYFDLPRRASRTFELAVGSKHVPTEALTRTGWQLVNPLQVIRSPWEYQEYIRRSKGEWSVAKAGYVVSRSGWFSDRSACYLASGRPAVIEDTGFTRWLPPGQGVLPFCSPDEAVDAIARVEAEYALHARAARAMAEEFFASEIVLTSMLARSHAVT